MYKKKEKRVKKIKEYRKTRGNDMFTKFDQNINCKNKHIKPCLVWFDLIYHTLNSEWKHMKFNLDFVNHTKPCTPYFHFLIFPWHIRIAAWEQSEVRRSDNSYLFPSSVSWLIPYGTNNQSTSFLLLRAAMQRYTAKHWWAP